MDNIWKVGDCAGCTELINKVLRLQTEIEHYRSVQINILSDINNLKTRVSQMSCKEDRITAIMRFVSDYDKTRTI